VTRDYSHAKVFYTVMDEKTREVSQEALDHSAGFLRSELGRSIKMFTTPQLHFVYDESVPWHAHDQPDQPGGKEKMRKIRCW
jgi:ribosome-binding factor A